MLWCPASAITVRMFGNNGANPPSNRTAAFRSEMSAGSTLHAISSPKMSTTIWRLRTFTGSVATLQSSGDRLAGCSSWHLRFVVYSSGGNLSRSSSCWRWDGTCAFPCRTATSKSCSPSGGVHADHVTVWRWVQRYAPELQRCLRRQLKPTNDSWRMDETYVRVKGNWRYLYRAVDSSGATLDFLLSAKQDAAAAKRFLAKALGGANHPAPRVINTDGHAAYPSAVAQLKGEGDLTEDCRHRPVPYLNNVLEQDHRAIKRRVNASQHFRSFCAARRTLAGY